MSKSRSRSHSFAQQEMKNVSSKNYSTFPNIFSAKTLLALLCLFWPISTTISSTDGNLSIWFLCQLQRRCQRRWCGVTPNTVLLWGFPYGELQAQHGDLEKKTQSRWQRSTKRTMVLNCGIELWPLKLLLVWHELTYKVGQLLPLLVSSSFSPQETLSTAY